MASARNSTQEVVMFKNIITGVFAFSALAASLSVTGFAVKFLLDPAVCVVQGTQPAKGKR